MNHNTIALGVCGTFGSPNGFQQCFYQTTPFSRSLDLDSKALEIAPGEPLFMIRRDGDTHTVCLAAYSSAREPQSSRRGTFIGSAVALPAGQFSAQKLSDLIVELHSDVILAPENIVDGVLQVGEAVKLTVAEPHALKGAEESMQAGRQKSLPVLPGQVALIAGSPQNLTAFLETGLHYFTDFDTLYFTANADTHRNAVQKGLVPVLSWQQFESEKEIIVQQEKAAAKQAEEAKRAASKKKSKTASSPAEEVAFFEPWEQGAQWSRSGAGAACRSAQQAAAIVPKHGHAVSKANRKQFCFCCGKNSQKAPTELLQNCLLRTCFCIARNRRLPFVCRQ